MQGPQLLFCALAGSLCRIGEPKPKYDLGSPIAGPCIKSVFILRFYGVAP